MAGGGGGIRTPGRGFSPYNGLANRRLQPLGLLSETNGRKHCNLQLYLVTVSLSIAAFWCTVSHQIVNKRFECRDCGVFLIEICVRITHCYGDIRMSAQLLHSHYIQASTYHSRSS